MKLISALFTVMTIVLSCSSALAIGGKGATCNPSTANWGSCTLAAVPFQADITNTVNIPGGDYPTSFKASQANTKYVLQGDIKAEGTAIEVKAKYVIIDLNGHTITYNQIVPGEGVTVGAYNLSYVSVRNGSIIQGAAMSEGDQYGRGNNPVGTRNTAMAANFSVNNMHIANLYVRYGGRDVGGIICAGNNGLYEQNTIEDTYEFGTLKNRHQGSEALTGSKSILGTGYVYRHNSIINSRHRGITTGNNAEAYGNHVGIRSIATNAGGFYAYAGKNIVIHDNTVIGRGEHPLGVMAGGGDGAENYEVYNNYFDMQITALGAEYGASYANDPSKTYRGNAAAGFRVSWGGDNLHVYNNEIKIVTNDRYVGTYSPTGAVAYIDGGGKGLFLSAEAGESSVYEYNTISVTGTGIYTYGIAASGIRSDGVFVLNNTVTSNLHNIVIGDDYSVCNDYPLFQGNTLIKSGNDPDYKTIANTYNTTDRNAQARFVDNIYLDGASENSISLLPEGSGLTDVYFGTEEDGEYLYSYRLHDGKNTSTTLLREEFKPAILLNYKHPSYAVQSETFPPVITKISDK